MKKFALIEMLGSADADWLLSIANTKDFFKGEALLMESNAIESLTFITRGYFNILQNVDGVLLEIDRAGSGDTIGEVAILEDRPSSVRITAGEASQGLLVMKLDLRARMDTDPQFACRFYKAVALLTARRLRSALVKVPSSVPSSACELSLRTTLDAVKSKAFALDREFRKARKVSESLELDLHSELVLLENQARNVLSLEKNTVDERQRLTLGSMLQRELLPYVLLTRWGQRAYTKPRGYAGDYLTIDWLYENNPDGQGPVGKILDGFFLSRAAAKAVRNRRKLVSEIIQQTLYDTCQSEVHLTSLACGPAREIFDVLKNCPDAKRLHAHLVDFDVEALQLVDERGRASGVIENLDVRRNNLVHLILGKETLELPSQDLIYSIGLVDYFDDSLVVRLLNLIYGWLRPGGRVLIGNFHPQNPTRLVMEYLLDWSLIHRTQADMDRLFEQSHFGSKVGVFHFEQEGVNLFAECRRSIADICQAA